MSGETQRQDDASEGDGRAWTPPPPHETPETLGDRYSSNLSQRPTPLAALDDLDAEDRAGFEELAERLKVARRDPKNVFHTRPQCRGYSFVEIALKIRDALATKEAPRERLRFLAHDATPRPPSVRTPPLYARTRRRLGRRTTPRELNPSPSPHEARPRARRSPRSSRPLWMMRTPCATRSAAACRRRDPPPTGAPSRPPSKPSLHSRPTSTRCDGTWPPCGRASRRRAPHGSSLSPPASR